MEIKSIFERNKSSTSQSKSYDVLKASRQEHMPESSGSQRSPDVGRSEKEMYEDIIGGDYKGRSRKQERLKKIQIQFETAHNYIEQNWHRIGDTDFGEMTRSSFNAERDSLVKQAEHGTRDALSKNMTKQQKYEAEHAYHNATKKLENLATALKDFLETYPLSQEVRALIEEI